MFTAGTAYGVVVGTNERLVDAAARALAAIAPTALAALPTPRTPRTHELATAVLTSYPELVTAA